MAKKVKTKIDRTDMKLNAENELLFSDLIKSFLPKKCEYCGCYDGIHRIDCSFMRRYW